MLEIRDLHAGYGQIEILRGINLDVGAGEIVAVLGANGAGKSSLLKALQGMVEPARGQVRFKGQEVTGRSAAWRVGQGLVLVPEGRQIFVSMSVHDNLLMGAYTRRDDTSHDIDAIYQRFDNLAKRRHMPASVLSGGEQQMLAIGRALLSKPSLMMLDEPSLGLSPLLVKSLFELIRDLNRDGLAILLVEQNASRALKMAQRAYVMESGEISMQGEAKALLHDPKVRAAYLGD